MITLALTLCKASSGEENLQHIRGPVIMYHCVSDLGSASIVLLACSQANNYCCELRGSQSK